MVPKKGTFVHSCDEKAYAAVIGAALRSELGTSHQAAKTLMDWTGASERSAKHWLSGTRGPRGAHLARLVWRSNMVAEAFLKLAGRRELIVGCHVSAARAALTSALAQLDAISPEPD